MGVLGLRVELEGSQRESGAAEMAPGVGGGILSGFCGPRIELEE